MAKRQVKFKIDDEKFKRDMDKLINLFGESNRKAILRKASRPLVKNMKGSNLFDDFTGEARSQIKSMTFKKSRDYFVGPKLGDFISERKRKGKYKSYDPYYMYFVEYGFTNWITGKYIPPTHFIQSATDASKGEVLAIIRHEVEKDLKPYTRK